MSDDISFPIPSTRHCLPTRPYDIGPDVSPPPPRECVLVVQRWRQSTNKVDPPEELTVPSDIRMRQLRALLSLRFGMPTVALYKPKSMDVAIADLSTVCWDDDLDSALVYNVPLSVRDSVLVLFCDNQPSYGSSSPKCLLTVQRWRPSTNTLDPPNCISVSRDISVGRLRALLADYCGLQKVSLYKPGCVNTEGMDLAKVEWNCHSDATSICHSAMCMRDFELLLFCDSAEYAELRSTERASASSGVSCFTLAVQRWRPSTNTRDAPQKLAVLPLIQMGQLRALIAQRFGLLEVSLCVPKDTRECLSLTEWDCYSDSAQIFGAPIFLHSPHLVLFCDSAERREPSHGCASASSSSPKTQSHEDDEPVDGHAARSSSSHPFPAGHKTQKASDGQAECCICEDNRVDAMLYPCLHVRLCMECAVDIYHRKRECPLCRAEITEIGAAIL